MSTEPLARRPAQVDSALEGALADIALPAPTALVVSDSKTRDEEKALAKGRKEALKGTRQNRRQRKTFAWLTFGLVALWLTAVLWLVAKCADTTSGYELDPGVLKTLIGSTTASIVGLFYIVTRYLFPAGDKEK